MVYELFIWMKNKFLNGIIIAPCFHLISSQLLFLTHSLCVLAFWIYAVCSMVENAEAWPRLRSGQIVPNIWLEISRHGGVVGSFANQQFQGLILSENVKHECFKLCTRREFCVYEQNCALWSEVILCTHPEVE